MAENNTVESKMDDITKALQAVKDEMVLNDDLIKSLKQEIENSNIKLKTNGELIASIKQMVNEMRSINIIR